MKKASGFSLIELLIVVAIIGILAGVAIPAYMSYIKSARQSDAKQVLLAIKAAQEQYYSLNDRYASDIGDLEGFTVVSGYYMGVGNYWRFQVSSGTTTHFVAFGEGDDAWSDRWFINDSLAEPKQ